jgi:hypothetical protein
MIMKNPVIGLAMFGVVSTTPASRLNSPKNKSIKFMKNPIQSSSLLALILAAGFFATTFPASGMPPGTLYINESNPSAVVITGGGPAVGTDGSTFANYGVDLANFFTSVVSIGIQSASGSPSLQPETGGNIYNDYNSDTYLATGGALLDLNLYSSGTSAQTFTFGSTAFSGTEVINLSAYVADIPTTVGSHGNIYAGDSSEPGNGTVIGQWEVTAVPAPVPEPATLALAGLGALGCMLMFWHRKS